MNINGAKLFNCKCRNLKIDELYKLNAHCDSVNYVFFSSDGNDDNSILLWDVKTGKKQSQFQGVRRVRFLGFSTSGTTIASCNGQDMYLWNLQTRRQMLKLEGHTHDIYSLCFSPDVQITPFFYGTLELDNKKFKLEGHSNSFMLVCFSPDGAKIASGGYDYSICLLDIRKVKVKLDSDSQYVYSVCFSPDGNCHLVVMIYDDLYMGYQDRIIKSQIKWPFNYVMSICFSPDDVKTGQQFAKLDGQSISFISVYLSPDGTKSASCSRDKSIRLWDVNANLYFIQIQFLQDFFLMMV
ncbi:unnamed protein product [Paramecium octaurelia]|uniref:Uncharacterized protein n=1 Tax=Paramecium octaurelia TaxID=43137 RepID=A0A8S1Y6Y6_PAROT|nr:unnamed protein product [Paramecium octaurelia]